jgi:hypothetical protein
MFGFCAPSNVKTQVVPRKYANEGDQYESNSPIRKVDVVRLKPQPQSAEVLNRSVKETGISLENEIVMLLPCIFVHSEAMNNLAVYSASLLSLSGYSFVNSAQGFTSSLAILVKDAIVKHQNPRSSPTPATPLSSSLSAPCKGLTHLFGTFLIAGAPHVTPTAGLMLSYWEGLLVVAVSTGELIFVLI